MIQFKSVKWRNFLSTGNYWNELKLNETHKTLIVGKNGHGKSTIEDVISFGLFGKPYRPINKPQLINSINGKNCEVQIEFLIGSNEYTIVRGIKPSKFQIYKNSELVNQESSTSEYQKYLETNILRFNQKTFNQIVVLSSSSYIPFMRLPAHHRREVIGDLLDVNVFNIMSDLAKKELQYLREKIEFIDRDISEVENSIESTNGIINDLKEKYEADQSSQEEKKNELKEKINELKDLYAYYVDEKFANNLKIDDLIEEFGDLGKLHSVKDDLLNNHSILDRDIKNIGNEAKKINNNEDSVCPTCYQVIDENHKKEHLKSLKKKYEDLQKSKEENSKEYKRVLNILHNVNEINTECDKLNKKINNINYQIELLKERYQDIELSDDNEKLNDFISKYQKTLVDLKEKHQDLKNKKKELLSERKYEYIVNEILKDNGLKSKIINEYIPTLNKFINYYLDTLDFFISFNLDETFNEIIRSRHRDDFTYESFSEGEKTRIDLAIIFAFRQIAKVKNAINTNLLILDEIIDSSLDNDGIENLMKILGGIDEDNNVFVISHKTDSVMDKFTNIIEFKKEDNFSRMTT